MNDRFFLGIVPQRCSLCPTSSNLLLCDDCKVVSYCGPAHQAADRHNHHRTCHAIKTAHEALAKEEAALRVMPGDFGIREDLFAKNAGHFWNVHDTRDYMTARFGAANALISADTFLGVEMALAHLMDMLRLGRSDNMVLRDIVPGTMLRLGQEQECYDFLKWWAVVSTDDKYDWDDTTLPYLDIRNADPLEPIDVFRQASLSLSQLSTLTLLKLRLLMDLNSVEARLHNNGVKATAWPELYGGTNDDNDHLSDEEIFDLNRPLGKFIKARVRSSAKSAVPDMIAQVEAQYHALIEMVHEMNPHFWETLISEVDPSPPTSGTKGSQEEANRALYQCKSAWEESGFALQHVDADTSKYVGVYTGPSTDVVPDDLPVTRGTGRVFPAVFKPPTTKSSPGDLFTLTPSARGADIRFRHCQNNNTILLFTDGACLNNGQADSRAGWAVVYGPDNVASGRLEDNGPFGDKLTATGNRAELRAVIAALRLCNWRADGVENIIMATDSAYVVDGATEWAQGWSRKGWKTRTGEDVKNRDLWEILLGDVERCKDEGLTVKLWKIPRELNTEADKAAKEAADAEPVMDFRDVAIAPSGVSSAQDRNDRVLLLCLEDEYLFDCVFGDLLAGVNEKADIEKVTESEKAIEILTQDNPPSIILVADAAITRQQKLFECVADRLRAGATVVLCGQFSAMVMEGEFSRLFNKLGLPWARAFYYRETVSLRRDAVEPHLWNKLPNSYSQKATFVTGLDKSDAWYTETKSSTKAAVAFTKVGYGRLGYIGDVNGEEESTLVVLAMCGLLD